MLLRLLQIGKSFFVIYLIVSSIEESLNNEITLCKLLIEKYANKNYKLQIW